MNKGWISRRLYEGITKPLEGYTLIKTGLDRKLHPEMRRKQTKSVPKEGNNIKSDMMTSALGAKKTIGDQHPDYFGPRKQQNGRKLLTYYKNVYSRKKKPLKKTTTRERV